MANAKIVTNGYRSNSSRLSDFAGPVRVISFDPYTPNQMQPGRNAGAFPFPLVNSSVQASILNAGGPGGPGSQGAKGHQAGRTTGQRSDHKLEEELPHSVSLRHYRPAAKAEIKGRGGQGKAT